MSKVLERATAHFRDKISGKLQCIDVPEWETKIYFKNSITLREQAKLIELATQGKQVEALVESLIVKARNEDGTKMFNPMDKQVFLNEIDPNVLIRVVSEINAATENADGVEVEKNS
jgi:hypothetical protein